MLVVVAVRPRDRSPRWSKPPGGGAKTRSARRRSAARWTLPRGVRRSHGGALPGLRERSLEVVTGDPAADGETRTRDLVVIGASAGGVEALEGGGGAPARRPPGRDCVVLHIAPTSTSALAGILGRAGDLPAARRRTARSCAPATSSSRRRPSPGRGGRLARVTAAHGRTATAPRSTRCSGQRRGVRCRRGRGRAVRDPGTTGPPAWRSSSRTAASPSCRTRRRAVPGYAAQRHAHSPSRRRAAALVGTRSPRSCAARRAPTTCVPAIPVTPPPPRSGSRSSARTAAASCSNAATRDPAVALPRRPPLLARLAGGRAGRGREAALWAALRSLEDRVLLMRRIAEESGRADGLARRSCSATRPSTPSARPTGAHRHERWRRLVERAWVSRMTRSATR